MGRFFGANYIIGITKLFSNIYYNPFVKIDEFRIKYGVIEIG